MKLTGVLYGALGLAALETLLSSGSARVAGLFAFPAAVARWIIDPTVPGLPNHTDPTTRRVPRAATGTTPAPADAAAGPDPPGFVLLPDAPTTPAPLVPPPNHPAAVPVPR